MMLRGTRGHPRTRSPGPLAPTHRASR
jgi:hypothetical protein